MHRYIANTKFATDTLIHAIFHEEEELARLVAGLNAAQRQHVDLGEGANFLAMNPDLDDEGLGQLKGMEAWETRNKIARMDEHKRELEQSIVAKEAATTALCGSLLQIAKQGLSLKYGEKVENCKPGRMIKSLGIQEIIWAGRNQSMHYEEGEPTNKHTRKVFATLEAEHGPQFCAKHKTNLARLVINLLQWTTVAKYTDDMELLLS
jgi:hypothetical protein